MDARGSACISRCGRYRWWLERGWQPALPRLLFIGLNPSTANAERDDPTLRRLIGYAQAGGFGGIEIVNLFARIGTSPARIRSSADPVGAANDAWILRSCRATLQRTPAARIWLGWGNGGLWRGRHRQVLTLLEPLVARADAQGRGSPLVCLGLTRQGAPRHPLYCSKALAMRPYAPSWGPTIADPPRP